MRDGAVGDQEIDGGWNQPMDWSYPAPLVRITNPGAIHDWEKKAREDYSSRFEPNIWRTPGMPAEQSLWEALKCARTARQVRSICRHSQLGSRLGGLYEHAEEFLNALKKDSRYPRKARTKDDQRLLHCARIMAGISCRVSPVTAVDKLRKLKHAKVRNCHCAACTGIKADLVQRMLAAQVDSRVSLHTGALAELDMNCNCRHCDLVTVKTARAGNQDSKVRI